jgi:hypothetical protein
MVYMKKHNSQFAIFQIIIAQFLQLLSHHLIPKNILMNMSTSKKCFLFVTPLRQNAYLL